MLLTLNAQEDCIHFVTVLDQFTQSALLSGFPQTFITSFALSSVFLLTQLHSEICLNLPRTLGHIYWKVVQLNLGIDPS